MIFAYGWAFSQPVRKVYCNLTVTALSIAVALLIGTVELLGPLAGQLGWTGGFWTWLAHVDLNLLGYLIVGMFALTWIGAMVVRRYARIAEKWAGSRP